MLDLFKVIFLGILEGLTEFIPVSSTAHLIVFGDIVSFHQNNPGTFEIAIQLGAILAVVFLYPSYFLRWLHPKNWGDKTLHLVMIGCIPVLVLAFFLYSFIKTLFTPAAVIGTLGLGGLVMMLVDRYYAKNPTTFSVEDMTYKQALWVGLSQCFSLWPGTSRSGSSIVGGLCAKLDHQTASKFSFLMSVPVMLAAVGYELLKQASTLTRSDFLYIGVGMMVSFIVGYLSMVYFLKLISRWKLFPFALYRIVFALAVYFFVL